MGKKITAGKWLGIVAFFFSLVSFATNYIVIIIDLKINFEYLYKIDLLVFAIFSIVWGAVFGSRTIKKITNKDDEMDESYDR